MIGWTPPPFRQSASAWVGGAKAVQFVPKRDTRRPPRRQPAPPTAPMADPAAAASSSSSAAIAKADPAPFYALGAGTLLIVVGLAGYLLSENAGPVTALIPAIPGVLLIVCGLVARTSAAALKHAMHAAAGVGLLGFLAAVGALIARWSGEFGLAQAMQTAMAVICGGFVALCVKSFRDARKRREAA